MHSSCYEVRFVSLFFLIFNERVFYYVYFIEKIVLILNRDFCSTYIFCWCFMSM